MELQLHDLLPTTNLNKAEGRAMGEQCPEVLSNPQAQSNPFITLIAFLLMASFFTAQIPPTFLSRKPPLL